MGLGLGLGLGLVGLEEMADQYWGSEPMVTVCAAVWSAAAEESLGHTALLSTTAAASAHEYDSGCGWRRDAAAVVVVILT